MERMSVNGQLLPTSTYSGDSITDEYTGHFLKVSYTQKISGHSVFSKDRVDVEGDGLFRFYIPKKELLVNEMVTLEVFAPSGEMLGRQVYSYGSLNAASTSVSAEDDSQPLEIEVDPKVIVFNETAPSEELLKKIVVKSLILLEREKHQDYK